MGAFSSLMLEAKQLGAIEINFNVRLGDYGGETDETQRWAARAVLDDPVRVPHVAVGRSGEEALRELVVYLKAIGG